MSHLTPSSLPVATKSIMKRIRSHRVERDNEKEPRSFHYMSTYVTFGYVGDIGEVMVSELCLNNEEPRTWEWEGMWSPARISSMVPCGLSEQETAHAFAGGAVVFRGPVSFPSTWCLVFLTRGIASGMKLCLEFCLADDDCNQAIEAEVRRRAMAAVIASAQIESAEQPTAPAQRRMGSI